MADSPVKYRLIVGGLLGYKAGDEVDRFDYALSVFQHAMGPVEVMNWGHLRRRERTTAAAQDMLLIEGVNDTYHYPRMVHAYAMAADLDVAGPTVEPTAALELPLVGGKSVALPTSGNRQGKDRKYTAVVVQKAEFAGIDGHYVPFVYDDLKHRVSCFLASHAEDGVARLGAGKADPLAGCN